MAFDTKKRETRKSLQQPGWITLEGGFAARPCVVRDLSSSGAKLTIEDPNTLPAKLRLAFSRDARTGRPCEVVWRRGQTVGIAVQGAMRKIVLTIIVAGWPALALAEQPSRYISGKSNSAGKQFKLKGALRENPCAEYGAGFVKLEGSDTCVKIGGYVSSGASAHIGAR